MVGEHWSLHSLHHPGLEILIYIFERTYWLLFEKHSRVARFGEVVSWERQWWLGRAYGQQSWGKIDERSIFNVKKVGFLNRLDVENDGKKNLRWLCLKYLDRRSWLLLRLGRYMSLFVAGRQWWQSRLSFWKWTFSNAHLEIPVQLWEGRLNTQTWNSGLGWGHTFRSHCIVLLQIIEEWTKTTLFCSQILWINTGKCTVKTESPRSLMSGASGGSDINDWGCNSWTWRIHFQGSFPLLSRAWAKGLTQLGLSIRIPTCDLSSMVVYFLCDHAELQEWAFPVTNVMAFDDLSLEVTQHPFH